MYENGTNLQSEVPRENRAGRVIKRRYSVAASVSALLLWDFPTDAKPGCVRIYSHPAPESNCKHSFIDFVSMQKRFFFYFFLQHALKLLIYTSINTTKFDLSCTVMSWRLSFLFFQASAICPLDGSKSLLTICPMSGPFPSNSDSGESLVTGLLVWLQQRPSQPLYSNMVEQRGCFHKVQTCSCVLFIHWL